uniref:Pentacotripeptide-repeat region of PRORP domain-containing protein n=1 Tax=Oryza brachyantha TaxID=4533 RepID=J3LWX0_ORYBR
MSHPRLSPLFAAAETSSAPASRAAYAAFRQRLRSGTLGPEDARRVFDELLPRAPADAFNVLLADLARAPPSAACQDGPALAIELFKRMDRRASPTIHTYGILISCYRRAHWPGLGFAVFGRLLRTGLRLNMVVYNSLIDCFSKDGKVDKAYQLLHDMKELGIMRM